MKGWRRVCQSNREKVVFIKNLLRRKIRTLLTVLGIAIGVAAIIGLGALANGLKAGYGSMIKGSKADLVLSQPNAMDISYSTVDEELGKKLLEAPEVSEVSAMLQGFTEAENQPFFFVFGYPTNSFIMPRFQIISGAGLDSRQAATAHGKPVMLGSAAAEVLKKSVGDTLRLTGSIYRIIGIYQTGDAFEDSGAVMNLKDAQELLGRQRQVSLFYIRLKEPAMRERFLARVERQWPDFSISGIKEFSEKQSMTDMLEGFVWGIGTLAIVIGGVGMMNAQLMAIMERTREIGVLRAVGWSSQRVLLMILMESVLVCLLGGLLGISAGYLIISNLSKSTTVLGVNTGNVTQDLLAQATTIVLVLGLVGGLYPAWRASRLQPVEALRYEGGSSGSRIRRLPFGGMAVQSLWQRSGRTFLTLSVIGLTVGAIMALESIVAGTTQSMTAMISGSDVEIMIRQADISDTSLSIIDDRVIDKIAAMPEVKSASGIVFSAVMMPEAGGFFLILGYAPNEFAIQRYKVVEGKAINSNHQIMIGRAMAESLRKDVGDTIELSGMRYSVVGIYESSVGWEELGGVVTLRDGQTFTGKPRKSTMVAVKLFDPAQAVPMVEKINREFPGIHAALTSDFANQMPDMRNSNSMIGAISVVAILVGGVGVLNTMLMSVFERTREIGVLRALGWGRRRILGLILREALMLGLLGGLIGIVIALGLVFLLQSIPMIGLAVNAVWNTEIFVRALTVALLLGVVGGLYPAFRATRLMPIEALRYE
jgi:ABC-type antimicrobial peptide transport system permease subunit